VARLLENFRQRPHFSAGFEKAANGVSNVLACLLVRGATARQIQFGDVGNVGLPFLKRVDGERNILHWVRLLPVLKALHAPSYLSTLTRRSELRLTGHTSPWGLPVGLRAGYESTPPPPSFGKLHPTGRDSLLTSNLRPLQPIKGDYNRAAIFWAIALAASTLSPTMCNWRLTRTSPFLNINVVPMGAM